MEKIAAMIGTRTLEVHRAISHILNGVGDPENMRPGERFQIDLSVPKFELLTSDGLIFWGPCQIISTYSEKDLTWSWPFGNSKTPEKAYHEIQLVYDSVPGLKALHATDKIEIKNFRTALELATFIALQAGYDGAYPLKQEGGSNIFVAVKPRSSKDQTKRLDWCSLCGRFPKEVRFLDQIAPSFNVCATCMELFRDIVDSSLPDEQQHPQPEQLCSACGQIKPARVAANYAYFCESDVDKFIKRLNLTS